jgi:protein gp37
MQKWCDGIQALPNVWIGVTAENQEQADKRIPLLLQIPAAKRFVSVEPMLGPVDLTDVPVPQAVDNRGFSINALTDYDDEHFFNKHPKLDWVICGGESGPEARPVHPDWIRSLRDQCVRAEVPFLFKQWGEWGPLEGSGAC